MDRGLLYIFQLDDVRTENRKTVIPFMVPNDLTLLPSETELKKLEVRILYYIVYTRRVFVASFLLHAFVDVFCKIRAKKANRVYTFCL